MSIATQSAVSEASHSDQEKTRVLFVDDDPRLLQGLVRSLHDHLEVYTASGAVEALRVLDQEGPFPVVVTDQNMPQVDGVAFLKKVSEHFPDTVRMMLTGNSDQIAAERAVNIGGVFRFLSKPCSTTQLLAAVASARREHDRRVAQRQVLEETVSGVTTLLTDMLAMAYPRAFARSGMVRAWVDSAIEVLNIPNPWSLRTASVLWPLSQMMLSEEERSVSGSAGGGAVGSDAEDISKAYMAVAGLLRNVPRFREVADMLVACRAPRGESLEGSRPCLQAELLGVLIDLSVIAEPGKPMVIDHDIARITRGVNRAVVAALPAILESTDARSSSARNLSAFEIAAGDILLTDLADDDGRLLLASGQTVSDSIAARIRQIASSGHISGKFRVLRS